MVKELEAYDAALYGVDTTHMHEHSFPVTVMRCHGEDRKGETGESSAMWHCFGYNGLLME